MLIFMLISYLQSSSNMVTVAWLGSDTILSGSDDELIVRWKISSFSNSSLSIILISNETLVSPAGMVIVYGSK